MKLHNLKEKLKNEIKENNIYLVKNKLVKKEQDPNKNVRIIGVTGSRGKSTVCYLIHNYLKYLGYKSILYSNCEVDSPKSLGNKKGFSETPLKKVDDLYNMIVEAENYDADFIVVEINETTLERGIIKNIDFDVCLVTNVNPKHNTEMYSEDEYVKLKKTFFEQLPKDSNCTCIIGLQDMTKELYDELIKCNNLKKFTYSTEHISEVKGVSKNKINCLLTQLESSLEGLNMVFTIDGKEEKIKTNILMPHNSFNVLALVSVMKVLNLLDMNKINNYLSNIKIPGRVERLKVAGRTILIDLFLTPTLEVLYNYKKNRLINNIYVVTGSIGTNYKDWDKLINSKKFIESRTSSRQYAMDLLKKYADNVYLTENDNASEKVEDICNELQSYLDSSVKSTIILDRLDAIRQAILDSNVGDVIFISGRANRNIICYSKDKIKYFSDLNAVKKVINELGWD